MPPQPLNAIRQTIEHAFETFLESTLTGHGWGKGDLSEWRVDLGLFPARVLAFVQDTQPELWQEMPPCTEQT